MDGSRCLGAVFRTRPLLAAVRLRPLLPHEAGEPLAVQAVPSSPSSSALPAVVVRRGPVDVLTCPAHLVFDEDEAGSVSSDGDSSQARLYTNILSDLVAEATTGASGTLVAYGGSGSGKSHSILGYGDQPGLIPRATLELFRLAAARRQQLQVWCSFLEVHQERLIDLLAPRAADHLEAAPDASRLLEVLELPGKGAQVIGLTECAVQSISEVQELVDFGLKRRAVASRLLGARGRSHTVLYLNFSTPQGDILADESCQEAEPERTRLTFVDCAASEQRGRDPSLDGLWEALSDLAEGGSRARGLGRSFYRRSRLTQLLQDSLGGHERLVLLATITPTLCGAQEAQASLQLIQAAVDASAALLRNGREGLVSAPLGSRTNDLLRKELEVLRRKLLTEAALPRPGQEVGLKARAEALQRALQEREAVAVPFSQQLQQAELLREAQQSSLEVLGISSEEDLDQGAPYLMRLSSDPMLTGCLVHALGPGPLVLGAAVDTSTGGLLLEGLGMAPRHCQVTATVDGRLWIANLEPGRARLRVNGRPLETSHAEPLFHGDRVQLGWAHELQLVCGGRDDTLEIALEADCASSRPLHLLAEEATALAKELVSDPTDGWFHERFEVTTSAGGYGQAFRLQDSASTIVEGSVADQEAQLAVRSVLWSNEQGP
ncbi:unnamed protein product, partial [Polarella glacialis]